MSDTIQATLADIADLTDADQHTDAETLGLLVGMLHRQALDQRDTARQAADRIAEDLAAALRHLHAVLVDLPEEPSTFAHTNQAVADARAFLTEWQGPTPVDSANPTQED